MIELGGIAAVSDSHGTQLRVPCVSCVDACKRVTDASLVSLMRSFLILVYSDLEFSKFCELLILE